MLISPASVILLCGLFSQADAQKDPIRPYPLADAKLMSCKKPILDHASYLTELHDPQWYLDNIPFVDFPDKLIQDIYYYRQSVVKRHLKYTRQGHGWVFTEFIHGVDHAAKFQTIADSAPLHIAEARWLRDPSYAKDLIQVYTRAGIEALTGYTFTNHVINAAYEHAQTTGDIEFLKAQLDGMIMMFNLWNPIRDNSTGLYYRKPVNDAQEYSLAGYVIGGTGGTEMMNFMDWNNDWRMHNKGPETYRPSFNAYMVANSRAIANIAKLSNRTALASEWADFSSKLESKMESLLWNEELNFWIDVIQERNNMPVMGRQLIGYFPYRFGIGVGEKFERGLEFGLNEEHFLAEFGPTTLEKTNKFYTEFKNSTTNTVWNGQSWPFSTCVYLTTLAMMARNNVSSVVTPEFFYEQLYTYAKTNTLDGVPFTAEAHYPTIDKWSALDRNHSEHYFHSTYTDNIFTNLLGIIPTFDNRLELRPLIPKTWTKFVVENLPYHGALLAFLWDEAGTAYPTRAHKPGLSVYVNGKLVLNQPTLAPFNVTMSNSTQAVATLATSPRYANIVANPNTPHQLPKVSSDSAWVPSSSHSTAHLSWRMNDGLMWYDLVPDNRWVNLGNKAFYATIWVELARPRTFSSVSLAVQSAPDSDIDCPLAIHVINNRTNELIASRQPWTDCVGNALNTISFSDPVPLGTNGNATTVPSNKEVTTDTLRIVLISKITKGTALSELQIWVPSPEGPRYEAEDGLTGTFVGTFWNKMAGMNQTVAKAAENSPLIGGTTLLETGWLEIADVRNGKEAKGGKGKLTIVGAGSGALEVQMNFLKNSTATLDGRAPPVEGQVASHGQRQNVTVDVEFLPGGNVVTLFRTRGKPFIDAIVVE